MRLKELRKKSKKNQTEIANYLNLTQQTYAKYELGKLEPSIQTLSKLADFYCVTIDYLIGREFNNEFGYMSDDEKALVRGYRDLNHINQVRIISQLQGLLIGQN